MLTRRSHRAFLSHFKDVSISKTLHVEYHCESDQVSGAVQQPSSRGAKLSFTEGHISIGVVAALRSKVVNVVAP